MKVSEAFPSKYLTAADLQGRNVPVVISNVIVEELDGKRKLSIYFQGKQKSFICNKTNANNIAAIYGDDTDGWIGQEVILFEAMVDYQGKTVPAIRVRAPQPKDRPRPPQNGQRPAPPMRKAVQQSEQGVEDDGQFQRSEDDQSIPF